MARFYLRIRELTKVRPKLVAILDYSANLHAAHFPMFNSKRMVLAGVFEVYLEGEKVIRELFVSGLHCGRLEASLSSVRNLKENASQSALSVVKLFK